MKLEWKSGLRLGVCLFGLFLLIHYWDQLAGLGVLALQVAWPLMLGLVLAYVVNIPMAFYERHFPASGPAWLQKLRRPVCLVLSVLSVLAIVVLIVRMILPELVSCVTLLLEQLPGALNAVAVQLETNFHLSDWLSGEADSLLQGDTDWQKLIQQLVDWLISGFGGAMASITGLISSVVSGTVSVVVAMIFSIYVLMGKERLGRQIHRLLDTYCKPRWTEKLYYVLDTVDNCFHRFIVGQCVEAVILGLLCIIGMLIFRFPYAVMIGTLIGFTALIPVAGAYIGAIVGALMIFTVSPIQAVLFIVFLVVLQQLEGNLIYPRVVGSSIGLPGIWVLAAVTVGGGLMGVGGMLLGVPLTAAVYQLLRHDMNRRSLPTPET
ncbi:MAG: AI-2E family transporter [Candidatus Onthomonas sp.]